jgi:predicted dehydrogenase
VDETVTVMMRFRQGRTASFTCSFGAADRSTYTVVGTRGTLTMDPAYEYAQGLAYQLTVGGKQKGKSFGKHDQFAAELLYFSDCILHDREPEPSGVEGLADVRLIEALNRSIKSGRWVKPHLQQSRRRPTLRQAYAQPPVPREPPLIDVESASQ